MKHYTFVAALQLSELEEKVNEGAALGFELVTLSMPGRPDDPYVAVMVIDVNAL